MHYLSSKDLDGDSDMQPNQLKEWRKALGISQEEAGLRLGVSRVAIGNWESGATPIPLMVDLACGQQTGVWRRRPDYGPVEIIDIGAWGLTARVRNLREAFPNNEAALARAVQIWEQLKDGAPIIVEAGKNRDVIWGSQDLKAEVEKRIEQKRAERAKPDLANKLIEIARHFSSLPVLDDRSDDEIVGYDEHGLPR
jgi:transcriptional regulator with XRE-family HTH domain